MFCSNCGIEVQSGSNFCSYCGTKVPNIDEYAQPLPLSHSGERSDACNSDVTREPDFWLFSVEQESVNIECKKCGKVYIYDRLKHFNNVSEDGCTTSVPLICPNCGTTTAAHSRIAKKVSENKIKHIPAKTTNRAMSLSIGAAVLLYILLISLCVVIFDDEFIIPFLVGSVFLIVPCWKVHSLLEAIICPNCGKFFTMTEINRRFLESRDVTREVSTPQMETYVVNKEVYRVQRYVKEIQTATEDHYSCKERCSHCGHIRFVKKIRSR